MASGMLKLDATPVDKDGGDAYELVVSVAISGECTDFFFDINEDDGANHFGFLLEEDDILELLEWGRAELNRRNE